MFKPSRARASWSGRSRVRRSCSVTTPGVVSATSLTVHFMAASLAPGRRTTALYPASPCTNFLEICPRTAKVIAMAQGENELEQFVCWDQGARGSVEVHYVV